MKKKEAGNGSIKNVITYLDCGKCNHRLLEVSAETFRTWTSSSWPRSADSEPGCRQWRGPSCRSSCSGTDCVLKVNSNLLWDCSVTSKNRQMSIKVAQK